MRPQNPSDVLASEHTSLTAEEILHQPPDVLLGVSAAARTALGSLDVRSVFDLAASRVFATAARLLVAHRDPTSAEARLDAVPADAVAAPAGVPVSELAVQPIAILKGIGPERAAAISEALGVTAVRDLALWRPYLAAKGILDSVFAPERAPGFDADAPADLLPRSGDYPTERIFFRKLLIDATAPGAALAPLEDAAPIDLASALAAPAGFPHMATGALLTFSQSWFSEGLTLGQLLHSTSLAPGESTRIAMIDWSRRTLAAATEEISETERLSSALDHNRSISEVTSATAQEFQTGSSQTSSSSESKQSGGGFGLDLGVLGIGGSNSTASSTTEAMSMSSSFGARDLAASYAQEINDRSQQNSSSVRNRRASIVREVSQEEHEQISTRVVTNYNHMHALSVQYYEVVQAFRVTTQLERAERCLFVPLALFDWSDAALVDRWRSVLAGAALTPAARRQLTVEYGVVEIIPQTPRVTPGSVVVIGARNATQIERPDTAAPVTAGAGAAPDTPSAPVTPAAADASPYHRGPANSVATILSVKGWDVDQLNRLGWSTGRVGVQAGSDSVFVSDDALVLGVALAEGQALKFQIRRRDSGDVPSQEQTPTAYLFRDPVPLADLLSLGVQNGAETALRTELVLHLNVAGTVMPLDVPIELRPGGATSRVQECVRFGGIRGAKELMDHLQANRLHYSQAVFRALDSATLATILARYTYRGLLLAQIVDQPPLSVAANCLVFRVNVPTQGQVEDPRWAAEQAEWRQWLARRGLDRPVPRTEIIPLPSGGVFAEAVLGRYNAAEKIDLKRFWNWQDSPIPLTASDIAPIQAGSRAQPEDVKPGQLSAPVINIQTPTALPEPAGIGPILAAIQNGNMFRDMSGMAQTAALAQAALQASAQGATAAGEQAGQNLKTVMDANTERMRIAAQLMSSGLAAQSGGGAQPPGKGTVTERGGELNEARTIDAERAAGGMRAAAIPTPVFASDPSGAAPEAPTTTYEDIFHQQAAGPTGQILDDGVKGLLAFDGGGDSAAGGSGGGGGSSTVATTRKIQVVCNFLAYGAVRNGSEFVGRPVSFMLSQSSGPHTPSRLLFSSSFTVASNVLVSPVKTIRSAGQLTVRAFVKFGGQKYFGDASFAVPLEDVLSVDVYVEALAFEQTVAAPDIDAAAAIVRGRLLAGMGGFIVPEKILYEPPEGEFVGGGKYRIRYLYFPGRMVLQKSP